MTSTQRPSRRRNARHAFIEDNGDEDGEGNRSGRGAAPAKRAKVDGSSGKVSVGAQTKSKKKTAAYDEDIDGFQFSRTRSKRIQAMEVATNTTAAPTEAATVKAVTTSDAKIATTKVPSKRKKGSSANPITESVNNQIQPPPRRSARLSGDKEVVPHIVPAPAPVPARSTNSQDSTEKAKRTKQASKHTSRPKEMEAGPRDGLSAGSPPIVNQIHVEKKRTATKIALPFADTPIIQRNKDMRKNSGQGHRRSSNGMRGRRASSLIEENKSNAFPHAEVETREFYKHIAQDLLEPKRMKQLLVWCGSRALSEKPLGNVENANERMTARTIQEELLKDFATNSDLSDVFSKRDVTSGGLVKRPNPRNIQNANKLKELERELERLRVQKREWDQLMSSSKVRLIPHDLSAPHGFTSTESSKSKATDLSSIDSSLLSPSESDILNSLLSLKTQPPDLDKRSPEQLELQQQRSKPASNIPLQQSNALSTPSSKVPITNTLQPRSQIQPHKSPHPQYPSSNAKSLSSSSHNESDGETQIHTQAYPASQIQVSQVIPPSPSATTATTTTTTKTSHPLQRIHHLAATVEPTIDSLAEGVHRLAQYKIAAERVAHDASMLASGALSAHDRQIKDRSGTAKVDVKDVLGALGSAIVEAERRTKGRG